MRNKYYMIATGALLAQAALFYLGASATEKAPLAAPLASFPTRFGNWNMLQEYPLEADVQEVLKADDSLNRTYGDPGLGAPNLFVAYFRSQRTGKFAHSPKHCLPGSGWEPASAGYLDIAVPDSGGPIHVNRYVVTRGDDKSLVLYWYQSRNRVIASEYSAKIWQVLDSLRYRRSDTALVRVTVPVRGDNEEDAVRVATAFVKGIFPLLKQHLPA